jgi:hypothetical protein
VRGNFQEHRAVRHTPTAKITQARFTVRYIRVHRPYCGPGLPAGCGRLTASRPYKGGRFTV